VIIKEYRCLDCGTAFETADKEPECPVCSSADSERAFFTPPSIRSPSTTVKDEMVKGLAADFGLSDLNNRHGQAVKQAPSGAAAPQFRGPEVVQNLNIPTNARDQLSPVLPQLQAMGGPRNWSRKQGK
jgi:hypothetical protein